jgi:transaldolase
MQDDPRKDNDPDSIVNAALRHSRVGENYMTKIPVTEAGMEAMAHLITQGIPLCATECFSIAQAVAMCEVYHRQAKKCGKWPPFFITHITGIYDEEIQDYVKRENVEIADEIVHQAGCIVGRKEYQLLRQRGYKTIMLGGGARGMHHFTEFVGGNVHITLNWSTVRELNETDPPVVSCIDLETPKEIIDELSIKIPDFRRAYYEDALQPAEFDNFAPLQRFRNSFLKGWQHLLDEIAARRALV